MNIAVLYEESGEVRRAALARGHNAVSVDLLPASDGEKNRHFQMDVWEFLRGAPEWDFIFAFPPCTFLCSSGLHWNKRRPGRQALTDAALADVSALLNYPCEKIVLENPIGCISSQIRPPSQIIQPWQFGHPESKSTCLWLKGVQPLQPTNILPLPACGHWENQTPSRQNKLAPGPERARLRAKTYSGIAAAMAAQWL